MADAVTLGLKRRFLASPDHGDLPRPGDVFVVPPDAPPVTCAVQLTPTRFSMVTLSAGTYCVVSSLPCERPASRNVTLFDGSAPQAIHVWWESYD